MFPNDICKNLIWMFQLLIKLYFVLSRHYLDERRTPTKFVDTGEINFGVRSRLRRNERRFRPFKGDISVVYPEGNSKRREHRRSRGNGAPPSNTGSRFYDLVWEKRAPTSHGSRENRRESPVDKESYGNCRVKT